MSVQVLLSTMYKSDFEVAEKCNIKTDAVIINQCDFEKVMQKEEPFGTLNMYSTVERGLSKSRNAALKHATDDICLICDDDVVYRDGYAQTVQNAFDKLPDADIIVFSLETVNTRAGENFKNNTVKKVSKYKSFSSVQIAFKRKSIVDSGIKFNEKFGTGSGIYPMSEDSIFFADAHKAKLKIYTYPEIIATVDFSSSSWFKGYDNEYFYGIGAFLSEAYPKEKHLLKWYYPLRMKALTTLPTAQIIKMINCGIKGYGQSLSYDGYIKKNGGRNL